MSVYENLQCGCLFHLGIGFTFGILKTIIHPNNDLKIQKQLSFVKDADFSCCLGMLLLGKNENAFLELHWKIIRNTHKQLTVFI